MISYTCPQCKNPLQSPESQQGVTVTCPKCQAQFPVSAAAASNKTLWIVLSIVGGVCLLGLLLICVITIGPKLIGTNATSSFSPVGSTISAS